MKKRILSRNEMLLIRLEFSQAERHELYNFITRLKNVYMICPNCKSKVETRLNFELIILGNECMYCERPNR